MKATYRCEKCLRSFETLEQAMMCEQGRAIINGVVQNSPSHLDYFGYPPRKKGQKRRFEDDE